MSGIFRALGRLYLEHPALTTLAILAALPVSMALGYVMAKSLAELLQ